MSLQLCAFKGGEQCLVSLDASAEERTTEAKNTGN